MAVGSYTMFLAQRTYSKMLILFQEKFSPFKEMLLPEESNLATKPAPLIKSLATPM